MTEEIIIDGVNVAGCISFDKNNGHNICCYDDTREDKIPFANSCVENKNCYYKQLKRLEQENKELKEDLKSQQMINLEQQEIALDYWNALEEIQKAIKSYDLTVDNGASVDTLYTIRKIINEVLNDN